MFIIDNYKKVVFENYANFEGRASRSEFWYFILANLIIGIIIGILEEIFMIPPDTLLGLYNLAIFLPSIAVGVRRIHDGDRSGWFILIPIYNFILAIQKGTVGPNRFGADPHADVGSTSEEPTPIPEAESNEEAK